MAYSVIHALPGSTLVSHQAQDIGRLVLRTPFLTLTESLA